MTHEHALDPTIELRLATRHATIPLHELAARLCLPVAELRGVLLALILTSRANAEAGSPYPNPENHTSQTLEGEGREGEERSERFRAASNVTLERKYIGIGTLTLRSVAREAEVIHHPETFAQYLATLFDDQASLPAYELLVRRHRPELVCRALDIVERTSREQIRGNPAAYFTGILANLAKKPIIPYARSPSSAS